MKTLTTMIFVLTLLIAKNSYSAEASVSDKLTEMQTEEKCIAYVESLNVDPEAEEMYNDQCFDQAY